MPGAGSMEWFGIRLAGISKFEIWPSFGGEARILAVGLARRSLLLPLRWLLVAGRMQKVGLFRRLVG